MLNQICLLDVWIKLTKHFFKPGYNALSAKLVLVAFIVVGTSLFKNSKHPLTPALLFSICLISVPDVNF